MIHNKIKLVAALCVLAISFTGCSKPKTEQPAQKEEAGPGPAESRA